jgi:hypothetical protein
VACVQEDINDTSRDRIMTAIQGLLINSYRSLVLDEDDRAAGFKLLANKVWAVYMEKIPESRMAAIGLPPMATISQNVVNRLLDPQRGFPPAMRAVLRTKLGLPAETAPASAATATNSPSGPTASSESVSTPAVPTAAQAPTNAPR